MRWDGMRWKWGVGRNEGEGLLKKRKRGGNRREGNAK